MRKTRASTALFLCLALAAHAASFTASLDTDSITLGESATLTLAFAGGQPQSTPMPEVPGLEIVAAGNSQTINIINGRTSSTFLVTYSITPQTTGTFVIPAMNAQVDGEELSSPPLTLTVLKAEAASPADVNSGSAVVFMKFSLPDAKIYVGEMLTARLEVWVRDDALNFGNFHFTGQPADGFTIGKMVQGQSRSARIGSHAYTVIPLTFALTAIRAGTLSLGPFTASATYAVASADEAVGDPFFGQLFNNGEQKRIELATNSLNAESLPLPAENIPADFDGAIGDFRMSEVAGPTSVAVGDPITVHVKISGYGSLNAITLPKQGAWRDFKVFPPASKIETTDQLGLQGSKTFEEIVIPQSAGARALPPLSFSYFNPKDGRYHTLVRPAVPLSVHPGGEAAVPSMAASENAAANEEVRQDIVPIKEDVGVIETPGSPLIASPGFLAVQCLPVLAFLGALVRRRRAECLANNPRLSRQRAVAKLILAGQKDLRRLASENKPGEFFTTMFRLLQEQLGERLDCPASAITENVIDESALLRTAPKATVDGLRAIFQLCNQARYAPVSGTAELSAIVAQFEKAIGDLQTLGK